MRWNFKFKSMVFFLMMFGLLLLMAGCGSDSNSGNPAPPTGPVDASLSDFIGTWGMWEQRGYTDLSCGGPDSAAEEIEYDIRIEQNGGQVQLYLFDDDNQSITCQLDDNELACQGTYNWGDGWSITYDEYRIYFIGVDHSNLKGEVTWTIAHNGETCSGTSGIDNVNHTGHPGDGHPGGDDTDDDGGSGDTGENSHTNGCTNGSDDDGDGDVDCDDADCAGDAACTDGGNSGNSSAFFRSWNIEEVRDYLPGLCDAKVGAPDIFHYSITIEQTGGQISLYFNDDRNQSLVCDFDGDDTLTCDGSYDSGDWSVAYTDYELTLIGNDTGLIGNAHWSDNNSNNCTGDSQLHITPTN
jgi:hypothetical protein